METIWITIIVAGLLTFGIRLSFILLMEKWNPPAWLERSLRYVPPAVLCAIIFPELLIRDGIFFLSFDNSRLLAGLVAGLVGWRTKNVLITIAAGMLALYLFQLLISLW
jgi:branched-subunit amino acid transport protein